jgi:SNF2 family DNA or RNA helicase
MTDPILRLSLHGSPPTVTATRGEIPDGFWLRLMSEWGTAGDNPGLAIDLTVDRLLARRQWLRGSCEQYRVGLDWQPELRALIESNHQERKVLLEMIKNPLTLDAAEVAARQVDGRFNRELRDFQIRDLGKLLALDNGANFSVPGAGKTTVAYAAYDAERTLGRVEQMLVVAPLSAFDSWQTGAEECFPSDNLPTVGAVGATIPGHVEILLVNYHRLDSKYDELAEWVRKRPTLLLLDEAHRMKRGRDGTFGRACLNMAFLASRRDILTGTPAPQSPQDLIALFDFLWPGQANRILPQSAMSSPPPPGAGAQVAAAIRPIFVRTRKSELGLDKPIYSVSEVEPDPLQAQIYEALLNQYSGTLTVPMGDRARLARMGDIVMYLLEGATNPHLLTAGSSGQDDTFTHPPLDIPPGSKLWDLMQRYNKYETPAKFQQLGSIIKANADMGRKTLVWTNFVRNIHALKRMLAAYEPATIYGAIPSEVSNPTADLTREAELARFRDPNGSCMVLLANPAAMSEGVSLHHDTHDAVYLDRTFNAGHYLQSVDRIHRLGLKKGTETRVTFLITKGTIDEVVNERIKVKAQLLGEMLDDPDIATMALPSDEDYGDAVDVQDLEALFKHLRGEK